MIIYVGDYWISSDLLIALGVIAFLLVVGIALWLASRSQRAKNKVLKETNGKTSATPIRSGLGRGR